MSYIKEYDYTLLQSDKLIDIFKNPNSLMVDWRKLFGNNNPIIVEVGCGNGHFLTNKAINEPQFNYIGIDIKEKRIIRCREKQVKYNLTNVCWVVGEALTSITQLFTDNIIDTIYMPFPDPWPKRRHHKNRLFKNDFLDVVYKKINSSGVFIFITDHEQYYQSSYKLISNDPRFSITEKSANFEEELTRSIFGEKWKKENRSFYMLCFIRK